MVIVLLEAVVLAWLAGSQGLCPWCACICRFNCSKATPPATDWQEHQSPLPPTPTPAPLPPPPHLQGDVYKFLKQQGGAEQRLGEDVVVPLVLEPFMQALQYIHEKVGCCRALLRAAVCKSYSVVTTVSATLMSLRPASALAAAA